MTQYECRTKHGNTFSIECDMAEASAPISVCWWDPDDPDDWQITPYQTADARHNYWSAAELFLEDDEELESCNPIDNEE